MNFIFKQSFVWGYNYLLDTNDNLNDTEREAVRKGSKIKIFSEIVNHFQKEGSKIVCSMEGCSNKKNRVARPPEHRPERLTNNRKQRSCYKREIMRTYSEKQVEKAKRLII